MAERQPPLWIDGGCYTGEDLRSMFPAMSGCDEGVLALGDLAVTPVSGMTVRVAAGEAWVAGTDQTGQGSYLVTAPTQTDVVIPTANNLNPRIDLIVAQVFDPAYGAAGAPRWAIVVVQGTPAASPVEPTPPDSALVLARVSVPAADTAIEAGQLTDRRVLCSGANSSPTGTILAFGGAVAPAGFLLCNGQAVSRTLYASLFAVLGMTYGAGDGSGTFNVPDLRGRFALGANNLGAPPTGNTRVDGTDRGSVGGEKDHALAPIELATHAHSINHDHPPFNVPGYMTLGSGGFRVDGGPNSPSTAGLDIPAFTGVSGETGSGYPHNTVPPYVGVNYIVRY